LAEPHLEGVKVQRRAKNLYWERNLQNLQFNAKDYSIRGWAGRKEADISWKKTLQVAE